MLNKIHIIVEHDGMFLKGIAVPDYQDYHKGSPSKFKVKFQSDEDCWELERTPSGWISNVTDERLVDKIGGLLLKYYDL